MVFKILFILMVDSNGFIILCISNIVLRKLLDSFLNKVCTSYVDKTSDFGHYKQIAFLLRFIIIR